MNIFSVLKDLITRKNNDFLENPENEVDFQPYLIQRWLSMYSLSFTKLLNNTVNNLYSVYETKKDWYKILNIVIPKSNFKKIKYIKKPKKEKNIEEQLIIEYLAKNKEISQREVKIYIEQFDLDINTIKKALK